jgi:hypothetical protein
LVSMAYNVYSLIPLLPQGLPGADRHCAEASESSSNLNQALQDEKQATTSDVKPALPEFPKTNLLHNDLVSDILFMQNFFHTHSCSGNRPFITFLDNLAHHLL